LPFRKAHQIATGLMAARRADARAPLSALLEGVSRELLGSPLQYNDDVLAGILSPRHFVDVRKTAGGPAPEETARALAASRRRLEADRDAWRVGMDALTAAERRLASRVAAL